MSTITLLFLAASQLNNLPPGLLSALCFVESDHVPTAIHRDDGRHNSVGICQIQLPTARFLGFKGSETQLRKVDTNISLASDYLGYQLRRYHGNIAKAVSAYNMGSYKLNSSGQIINRAYVAKVMKAWKERR